MLAPTPASPEFVGMSQAALDRLEDHLKRRYMDAGRFPGLQLLIYRRGDVVHSTVQGFADVERKKPVKEDTIFRIYSMTKPMTSVAFMMLVEQGLVALDDPVHRYIPEWKDLGVYNGGLMETFRTKRSERPMLIVDLLRHTSGLTYGFQQSTNVDAAYRKLEDRRDREARYARRAWSKIWRSCRSSSRRGRRGTTPSRPTSSATSSARSGGRSSKFLRTKSSSRSGWLIRTSTSIAARRRGSRPAMRSTARARRAATTAELQDDPTRPACTADIGVGRRRAGLDGERLSQILPHADQRRRARRRADLKPEDD